jgi:hypothetical protein
MHLYNPGSDLSFSLQNAAQWRGLIKIDAAPMLEN